MKKQQSGLTNQVDVFISVNLRGRGRQYVLFIQTQLAPKLLRPFKSVLVLLVLLLC